MAYSPVKIGEVFGRLTVLAHSKTLNNKKYFLCRCSCGNETEVISISLRSGVSNSCGCLRRDLITKDPGTSTLNAMESAYKVNARRKHRVWEFTREQFRNIVKQTCHWCGVEPTPRNIYLITDGAGKKRANAKHTNEHSIENAWVNVNGIDRLDSSKGYTADNTIPCCTKCNTMKLDYTVKEFIDQCKKIAERFK